MTDDRTSGAPARPERRGPGADWPSPVRWGAAALSVACLALLVVVIVYAVLLLFFRPSTEGYRDTALAAARQAATDFSTYDYRDADNDFTLLEKRATGKFREEVSQAKKQLVPLLKEGKATAQGTVREAAVTSASSERVQVIAVVDETVTNTAIPDGALRRYRFLLVMNKVDGRWLVSDLQQV